MFMQEPLLYRLSVPARILTFLLVILLSVFFTLILGVLLGIVFYGSEMMDYIKAGMPLLDPDMLSLLRYLQIINTIGLFVLPPFIFAFLISKRPLQYLSLRQSPCLISLILGIGAIMAGLPFLHWTLGLNEMLSLPEWLAGVEDWMRRSEDQARALTELLLGTSSPGGLMINMLMIAVLPALGEELLFRGVLLRLFREWSGSAHLAVIITAFLFSTLHLQFFGFLPRFLLGLLLGYAFVWSKTIWVPVLLHFFNNGFAVVAAWLFARGMTDTDADSLGDYGHPGIIAASLVVSLALLWLIRFNEKKRSIRFGMLP
jgi:uncharacterized protein